jgi:Dyp-type peroxidase family
MAAAAVSAMLDLDDVQGLIVRAHGALPAASFLLLGVTDAAAAGCWVAASASLVASGRSRPDGTAMHIAFTSAGLRALGLGGAVVELFANEFTEGMVTAFRQRLLGDTGESAPKTWAWGGPGSDPVHAAVLLYGRDEASLAALRTGETGRASAHGWRVLTTLDTVDLKGKEQFGFHDGVSQPLVAGLPRAAGRGGVPLGEFVLGYEDSYRLLGERPVLPASDGAAAELPRDAGGSGGGDLGCNGTYLVFRQLRQDVRGFWRFLDERTRRAGGEADEGRRTWLASRMVGRWPSGAPLVLSPDADDASLADANDFRYHDIDPDGLRCPAGSHVRRTNPRDALDPKPGSTGSLEVNDHHRILRRGREYGAAVDAATLLDDGADPTDRGLQFMCLNASIRRQFEFVQHTWINAPRFAGLYNDDDPVIGARDRGSGNFTVPSDPVRLRVCGLPRFVTVCGGAYFFLPGIKALRYLGSLDGGAA